MPVVNEARNDDGNVVVAVPAVLLIVVLLASLTVDAAALYLAQRRLGDVAAAIANDAVAAIDLDVYYAQGVIQPRLANVATRIAFHEQTATDGGLEQVDCWAESTLPYVTVTCTATTRPVMLSAWPHASSVAIRTRAVAAARDQPG